VVSYKWLAFFLGKKSLPIDFQRYMGKQLRTIHVAHVEGGASTTSMKAIGLARGRTVTG
jgi:hypothetical protein